MDKRFEQMLHQGRLWTAIKDKKRFSTLCVIREMKYKTTSNYHQTTIKMLKLKKIDNTMYF